MKCNIVPLRQNWRDWELHHNKSNGYYCTHFSLSLSFFTHYVSPSPPSYLLFYSLCTDYTHSHTHTYPNSMAYKDLHLLEEPILVSTGKKKSLIFTISSILDCPNGFQLPNLKANEVDAFLCPHTAF